MTPEEAKRTQRPYRYGMLLLCFGALINWVGLAENYTEPIRYAGVACILSGGLIEKTIFFIRSLNNNKKI